MLKYKIGILIGLGLVLSLSVLAAPKPTRILFIFDCSGSMRAKWSKEERMTVAKSILIRLVDSLKSEKNIEMALRCYGHQYPVPDKNCTDSKLEVPFAKGNAQKIIQFVKGIQPKGWTPIAYSLEQSASDFPDALKENAIILITDGIEECGGNPCSSVQVLKSKGITLKPYIIGIGLTLEKISTLDCIGKTYLPTNEKNFGNILSGVVSDVLHNTTLQLFLRNGEQLETNIAFSLMDASTKKQKYHFQHTFDKSSKPDTFSVDPNFVYDFVIHTLPEIKKERVPLQTAHHSVVDIKCPVGVLSVNAPSPNHRSVKCLIREKNKNTIFHSFTVNEPVSLLAGNYEVELLTMPRLVWDISIEQGKTKTMEVPTPGILTLTPQNSFLCSIYKLEPNGKQTFLSDFETESGKSPQFVLLSGNYLLVSRKKENTKLTDTKLYEFTIPSGGMKSLVIQ